MTRRAAVAKGDRIRFRDAEQGRDVIGHVTYGPAPDGVIGVDFHQPGWGAMFTFRHVEDVVAAPGLTRPATPRRRIRLVP